MLPRSGPFPGTGMYALYYLGGFPAYAPIAPPVAEPAEVPIYVGRAIPRGMASLAEAFPTRTDWWVAKIERNMERDRR